MSTDLSTDEVAILIDILSKRRGWSTAKQIASAQVSITRSRPWHRRHIAELTKQANGRIISTTHGYKLQDMATREEILNSYKELTEKAKSTGETATAIMAYFHRMESRQATAAPGNQPDLFTK
jgi:hypothetical protein